MRNAVAAALLGLEPETGARLVGDVGGGFGMKTGIYAEDTVVAHAARALGRPVKWAAERLEEFLAAVHGRDARSRAELALDAGRPRARACACAPSPTSAPTRPARASAIQLLIGPWVSTSIYDIPPIDLHVTAVMTNTAPTGPYRGAGRPEEIYLIERLMDAAARGARARPGASSAGAT